MAEAKRKLVNGAATPPWPRVPEGHELAPWCARMEAEVSGANEKLDLVLAHVNQPSPFAKACTQALGPKGENVKWIGVTVLGLAIVLATLWGASVQLGWGDASIATGGAAALPPPMPPHDLVTP